MAIETQTYQMYNHCTSKIIVALRDGSITVEEGTRDRPSSYPFTMMELQQIANGSTAIQCGYLRPSDEEAEFIYDALRIKNWKDILTEEQIEQIILHPTVEGLTRLINIKDAFYYERIYGVFIGLKNVNAPIAANVDRLLRGRYRELQKGKITTEFVVHERDLPMAETFGISDNSGEVNALKETISEKDKLIEQLKKQLAEKPEAPQAIEKKPAPKSVKRKTTTTKKTTGV